MESAVSNLSVTREDKSSTDGGGGLGMSQAHYVYCALYFNYYYIVIHNKIIIQLSLATH